MGATRENCQAKDEQPRRPHPYLLRQIPAAASDGGPLHSSVIPSAYASPTRTEESPGPETARNRIRNKIDYGAEASGFAVFLILLGRKRGTRLPVLHSPRQGRPQKLEHGMEVGLFSPRHYA